MTRDPPASPVTAAAKIASNALVPHSQDALCIQRPPLAQGLRQSSAVDILELAPDRHAPRKARHLQAARPEKLTDVMRGGLAFVGEIRRQHHLPLARPASWPKSAIMLLDPSGSASLMAILFGVDRPKD